jgi:hypothetical protein
MNELLLIFIILLISFILFLLVRRKICSNKEIYKTLDTCSSVCPPDRYTDDDEKKCLLSCPPEKFTYGKLCVTKCPNYYYNQNRFCGGPSDKRFNYSYISNDGRFIYATTYDNDFYIFYDDIWKKLDKVFKGNIIKVAVSGKGNFVVVLTEIISSDQITVENKIYFSNNYGYSWEEIIIENSEITNYILQGRAIDLDMSEDGFLVFFLFSTQDYSVPIGPNAKTLVIKYNTGYKTLLRTDYHEGYNFNKISCGKNGEDYIYALSLRSTTTEGLVGIVSDKIKTLNLYNIPSPVKTIEINKNADKLIVSGEDKKIIFYNILINNSSITLDTIYNKVYDNIVFVSSDNHGKHMLGYTFSSGFTGKIIKYDVNQNISEKIIELPKNRRFSSVYVCKNIDIDLDGKYQIVSEDYGSLYYSKDYGVTWIQI